MPGHETPLRMPETASGQDTYIAQQLRTNELIEEAECTQSIDPTRLLPGMNLRVDFAMHTDVATNTLTIPAAG